MADPAATNANEKTSTEMRSWRKKLMLAHRQFTTGSSGAGGDDSKASADDQHAEQQQQPKSLRRQKSSYRHSAPTSPAADEIVASKYKLPLPLTSKTASASSMSPAVFKKDLIMDKDVASSIADADQQDTPRSGVRLHMGHSANTGSSLESTSSGDEVCTYSTSDQKHASSSSNFTPLQRTLARTNYTEFIIRPLLASDYGTNLLKFISSFDSKKSKQMVHSKFIDILLERKRVNHYTFVAVSSEHGTFMCLASIIVMKSILSAEESIGFIDNMLVLSQYQNTLLHERMLSRLLEVAKLIGNITEVIVVCNSTGISHGLLSLAKSCETLGTAYAFTLKK